MENKEISPHTKLARYFRLHFSWLSFSDVWRRVELRIENENREISPHNFHPKVFMIFWTVHLLYFLFGLMFSMFFFIYLFFSLSLPSLPFSSVPFSSFTFPSHSIPFSIHPYPFLPISFLPIRFLSLPLQIHPVPSHPLSSRPFRVAWWTLRVSESAKPAWSSFFQWAQDSLIPGNHGLNCGS